MKSAFEMERDKWNAEVETVAAKLVRGGTPPVEAMERARKIVSARRAVKPARPDDA